VRLWLCAVVFAGCGTDLFALPYDVPPDFRIPVDDDLGGLDGAAADGDSDGGGDGGNAGGDLAAPDGMLLPLPDSCAQLGCIPAGNEGDVDLSNESISGCHAYDTLTISGLVTVDQSNGQGFAACANHIIVGFALSADGRGFASGSGPGAGGSCGSGGGHGGKGGDATGCGGGPAYDDPNLPRLPGSGGGSFGGGGGAGGGAIELAAERIDLVSFITANGAQGSGAVAGGGGGGSILIRADQLTGAGSVQALGGGGLGLGGGGGGGRVAIFATTSIANLSVDVSGGGSMSGNSGADGTKIEP
jgi:hypothetical protein